MEKRRPHFPFHLVLRYASTPGAVRFTRVAYDGAVELQMTRDDMVAVLRNLKPSEFFKSMTTYGDHTIWQDVYHPHFHGIPLYLKLTLVEAENLLVISLKRR
jgi:motility quorum-sensing regulator/GCU-specific mRNA interferase toxin